MRSSELSVSPGTENFTVLTGKDRSRGKELYRRICDPLLDNLHIQNRFAIGNEHAIDGEIKTPDQTAELPRMPAELLALYRHIRHANRRAKPVLSGGPRFAHPIARRFHHRAVNFLELHARPAHPHQGDE